MPRPSDHSGRSSFLIWDATARHRLEVAHKTYPASYHRFPHLRPAFASSAGLFADATIRAKPRVKPWLCLGKEPVRAARVNIARSATETFPGVNAAMADQAGAELADHVERLLGEIKTLVADAYRKARQRESE